MQLRITITQAESRNLIGLKCQRTPLGLLELLEIQEEISRNEEVTAYKLPSILCLAFELQRRL